MLVGAAAASHGHHGAPAVQSLALAAPPDPIVFSNLTAIRPNVRGSSGYGNKYEVLDDREDRKDAIRDIGVLLDWIATQPDLKTKLSVELPPPGRKRLNRKS